MRGSYRPAIADAEKRRQLTRLFNMIRYDVLSIVTRVLYEMTRKSLKYPDLKLFHQ